MTLNEEIRPKIEEALRLAAQYKEQKEYKRAYNALRSVETLVQAGEVESTELRRRHDRLMREVRQAANAELQAIQKQLDALFNRPVAEFDEEVARSFLSEWEQNLLGEDRQTLDSYSDSVDRRSDDRRDYEEAARVRREVEGLWQEARHQQATTKIPPGELFNLYYDRAYSIAAQAAAEYPDNSLLVVLKSEAWRLREEMGNLESLSTSAGQFGKYVDVLDYIDTLKDDDWFPYYRSAEDFVGNFRKQDAKTRLEEEARAFAREKKNKYRSEAMDLRDQFRPREALQALEHFDSYNVTRFLESNDRDELIDLRTQINEHAARLEDAERLVEQARKRAKTGAFPAWQQYVEGARSYPGVLHYEKTLRVANQILDNIRQELKDAFAQQQLQFQAENYRQVIEESDRFIRDCRKAIDDARPVLGEKVDVAHRLELSLKNFQDLRGEAQRAQTQRDTLRDALEQARQWVLDQRLEEARRSLEQIENSYPPDYLNAFKLYGEVSSELSVRLSAEKELERLKGMLTHPDPVAVQRAQENARAAANVRQDNFADKFADVADQLGLHLDFLRAQREVSEGQFEDARKRLESLLLDDRAPDMHAAERLLEEVKQTLTEAEDLSLLFQTVVQLLKENRAEEAYERIKDVRAPASGPDRRRFNDLRGQAVDALRERIKLDLRQLRIDSPSDDLEQAEKDLSQLEFELEEAPGEIRRLRRQLNPYIAAAAARKAEDVAAKNEDPAKFEEARRHWTRALDLAKGRLDDEEYINRRLYDLEKKILSQEVDHLLARARNSDREEDVMQFRSSLHDLSAQLEKKAKEAPTDPEFVLWNLEILLAEVELTSSTDERLDLFNKAASKAGQIRRERFSKYATALLNRARLGPGIGRAMKTIESRLGPEKSIQELEEAIRVWQDELEPHKKEFPFADVWYHNLYEDTVRKLSDITQKRDVEGKGKFDYLGAYAKLRILGSVQGNALDGELYNTWSTLSPEIERLLKNYRIAGGYEHLPTPLDQVKKQIEDLSAHWTAVELIRSLLDRFRESTQELRELAHEHEGKAKTESQMLKQAFQELDSLQQKYEAALALLSGEQGNSPERQRAASDLYQKMQVQDFRDHPLTKDLGDRLSRIAKGQTGLTGVLDSLRDAMKKTDYRLAESLVKQIDPQELNRYGLEGALKIPDGSGVINTWKDVQEIIPQRRECFDRVLNWYDPFDAGPQEVVPGEVANGAASSNGFDEDEPLAGGTSPEGAEARISRVVNWEAERQRIEADLKSGQFERARQRITRAVTRSSRQGMCLHDALARAENPPLADTPDRFAADETDDINWRYHIALDRAGSETVKKMLTWVREVCIPEYREQLEEADALWDEINQTEQNWKLLDNKFKTALKEIAALLDERSRSSRSLFKKGKEPPDLNQKRKQAHNVINQMANLCPSHPLIKSMREHALLAKDFSAQPNPKSRRSAAHSSRQDEEEED